MKKISCLTNLLKDKFPIIRIILGIFIVLGLLIFSSKMILTKSKAVNEVEATSSVLGESTIRAKSNVILTINGIDYNIMKPSEEEINEARILYKKKLRKIEEERRRREEERERRRILKVQKLRGYLNNYNSPMAPYSELILDSCEKYGIEYCKFYLSIAGIESGFGRVTLGCCNAWGMVGKNYNSWEVSIPSSSDWIAQNYYLNGIDTFEELAYSSYGPHEPEVWITNLYSFYNRIPL